MLLLERRARIDLESKVRILLSLLICLLLELFLSLLNVLLHSIFALLNILNCLWPLVDDVEAFSFTLVRCLPIVSFCRQSKFATRLAGRHMLGFLILQSWLVL